MLRFAITDRRLLAVKTRADDTTASPMHMCEANALVPRCLQLAREGIDFLLIREKDLPNGELVPLCRAIHSAIREARLETRVLVSFRADVALAACLDGVHLSSHPTELTPAHIRELYRRAALPAPFVSVSCHTLEEVRNARLAQASAALFAPVFGKIIQGAPVTPPAGLDALRSACMEAAPMPVFALGGVSRENAAFCLEAGAAGIAAIRMFFEPIPSQD